MIDFNYYGRWTSSVLNILIYNVAGGGESHLYGTEGPLYYLRNGFNNFNFCFVLALLFLGFFPIAKKKYAPDLLIVVSPIYIWLGFMSLQPHKEERYDKIFTRSSATKLIILCLLSKTFSNFYILAQCICGADYYTLCYEIEMDIILLITLSTFYFSVISNTVHFENRSLDGYV